MDMRDATPEIGTSRKRRGQSRPVNVAGLLLELIPLAVRELRKDIRSANDSASSENSGCGERGRCLTIPQFRTLANLWIEPLSNKRLAESMGMSVPATSRMVKTLTSRGLLKSTREANDKREVRVRLTRQGEEAYRLATEALGRRLDVRMEEIPSARLKKAEAGLLALRSILSDLDRLEN